MEPLESNEEFFDLEDMPLLEDHEGEAKEEKGLKI